MCRRMTWSYTFVFLSCRQTARAGFAIAEGRGFGNGQDDGPKAQRCKFRQRIQRRWLRRGIGGWLFGHFVDGYIFVDPGRSYHVAYIRSQTTAQPLEQHHFRQSGQIRSGDASRARTRQGKSQQQSTKSTGCKFTLC